MLSGSIVATLNGGVLKITGDNSANQIDIRSTGGVLRVITHSNTRLNGVLNGELAFAIPTRTTIDLIGGSDTLTLEGNLGGDVAIQMGSGSDDIRLFSD